MISQTTEADVHSERAAVFGFSVGGGAISTISVKKKTGKKKQQRRSQFFVYLMRSAQLFLSQLKGKKLYYKIFEHN